MCGAYDWLIVDPDLVELVYHEFYLINSSTRMKRDNVLRACVKWQRWEADLRCLLGDCMTLIAIQTKGAPPELHRVVIIVRGESVTSC